MLRGEYAKYILISGVRILVTAVQALDFAGTYGVLTLFGLIPAASVWSQRYGNNNRMTPFKVKHMSSQAWCY